VGGERELCADLSEGYELSEWQPIETAPRDGTRVLVFSISQWEDDAGIYTAFWDAIMEDWVVGFLDLERHGCLSDDEVTHWMPLPKAPNA
jgi:hypothetical protein